MSQMIISRGRVLIVEDSPSLAAMYVGVLENDGFEVVHVGTGENALQVLNQQTFDVVLLDLELPGMSGIDVLDGIKQDGHACAVIVITAHGSIEVAVECMAKGVIDFLEKPVNPTRLSLTVSNAQKQTSLESQVTTLRATYQPDGFENFVGSSQKMQSVYTLIRSAAPSKAPIFIVGESGTGKELCAEAVHKRSERANGPFVVLNCAAIPRELMESEIFGHVKGAFTGATADRAGAAERADGGTLFLDEICEMPIDLQSKLLRFLQTGAIQKVGGSKTHNVDVRIVCATNRDPWNEVHAGTFREDLDDRLYVIAIPLPALRERDDDVLKLADHFLQSISKEEGKQFRLYDETTRQWIRSHSWPGNVRELQNWVRNIVVLNQGEMVTLSMVPVTQISPVDSINANDNMTTKPSLTLTDEHGAPSSSNKVTSLSAYEILPLWIEEKAIIERAIEIHGGNIQRAAAALEISPSTIYRKKQAWHPPEFQHNLS